MFRRKLINYTIKWLKNAKNVLVLVQDMEDPMASFETKNEPKDLYETESKSEFKKYVLATRVRHYIERESILVSNMNKMYIIIWVQCTPGIQSVLKVNKYLPYKSKNSTR